LNNFGISDHLLVRFPVSFEVSSIKLIVVIANFYCMLFLATATYIYHWAVSKVQRESNY